jgi:hypothetical protein
MHVPRAARSKAAKKFEDMPKTVRVRHCGPRRHKAVMEKGEIEELAYPST